MCFPFPYHMLPCFLLLAHRAVLLPPPFLHPSLLPDFTSLWIPPTPSRHTTLFLHLSQSDLTGEHSCPAIIPPHSLFCFRPFPLSNTATTLLSFCPSLFPPLWGNATSLVSSRSCIISPICYSHNSLSLFMEATVLELLATLLKLKGLSVPMTLGSVLSGALFHGWISDGKLDPRRISRQRQER